ncbi:hypothetical protein [Motiliproteus sediminis]|uniref:hypothetical protein n=1 Tax=Motiliproteus sediminis TaxID=1468178 RepID=UPI001AEFACA3|nr:hypothetical protein [Motiliproteus sediminis]
MSSKTFAQTLIVAATLLLAPLLNAESRQNPVVAESRALQIEATRLLFDFYYTEQSLLFPEYDLITLQFNQEYGAQMLLQRLEIWLNGNKVDQLEYSFGDIEKLMAGAHQRIYATLLPAGSHTLKARLYGIGFRHGPYLEGEVQIEKAAMPIQLHMRVQGANLVFEQW